MVLLLGDASPAEGFSCSPIGASSPSTGIPYDIPRGSRRTETSRRDSPGSTSLSVGYDGDGYTVVPTFEIIATVAAGSAGDDGDY